MGLAFEFSRKFGFAQQFHLLLIASQLCGCVVDLKLAKHWIVICDILEDSLLASNFVLRRYLAHKFFQLGLSFLRHVSVVDVFVDFCAQIPLQVKVKHRCVGQIHLLLEKSWIFREFLSITSHIADQDGISDGANCKQGKCHQKFKSTGPWHHLSDAKQIEASVQPDKIGSEEIRVVIMCILPIRLVCPVLIHVHKVHVLDPALVADTYSMPNAAEKVQSYQNIQEHPGHL